MRRPKWWQEIAFLALCYWLYSLVRNAVPDHAVAAQHRAVDLLAFEHTLRIGFEKSLNIFVTQHHWLAYACNYYYATLHFVVTIGVLVWLYLRHPLRYRSIRSVLFATNIVAMAGFWLYALAPPRMLAQDGFVDTIVAFHTWGSWGSADVAKASNQFAAMPSLHVGWSLWCAVAIVALAERRWVRVLGALYPCATLFVIVGTANHFLLDAVGGALALAAGFAVQRVLSGRPAFASPTVATLHHSELPVAA
ncbi:MAG: hypothetical protein QOJ03_241 [Frankiaceae bacterium]|nr:hypothetical protein [Frankiaceae bacterium]